MCDLRTMEFLETTKKGKILTIGSNLNIQHGGITNSLQTAHHNDNILSLVLRYTFFML